ncbi:MAG TPA: hypothetical protein VGB59_02995 [Allosphingosinicella sp.]|jgi:hypothetical protein
MSNFSNLKQTIVSALGALLLTSTAVGAAVGPARAIETAPALYAQTQIVTAHV